MSEIAQSRNLFRRGGLPGEGAIPTYRTVAMNVSRVTHRLRCVIALQAIKTCSVWRSVVGHCYTRFPVIVAFDALPSFVRCFTSLDAPFISLCDVNLLFRRDNRRPSVRPPCSLKRFFNVERTEPTNCATSFLPLFLPHHRGIRESKLQNVLRWRSPPAPP